MGNRKILFIVEGKEDERKLIEKSKSVYGFFKDCEIYSYNTTIHELIRKLFSNGKFDDEIDLLMLLKENETNEARREILSKKYTDVYMIFDFDPHYQCKRFNLLKKMLNFFNDSTGNGKLYLNYPMMQSYKHLKSLPDNSFKDLQVTIAQTEKYKEIVGKESKFSEIEKYNYIVFTSILIHHLKKVNYIVNSKYELMSIDEFINFDFSKLLEIEINLIELYGKVDVVNTYIFSILDYAPIRLMNQINKNIDRFLV